MANSPLDSLTEYSTPGQTQQPQQTVPDKENDRTPGQKRKRPAPAQQQEEQVPQPNGAQQITQNPTNQDQTQVPPHATPTQEGPLPRYTMPQFGRARSQSPPTSPTSEAQKRRKLQDNTQPGEKRDKEQRMAVDDEGEHPVEQVTTPKNNAGRRWDEEDQDNEEDQLEAGGRMSKATGENVTVEVDELANAKTLARILMVTDKNPTGGKITAYQDPLEKYTLGPMPNIHDEDPATLLARIDQVQVHNWLSLPTGKVLARPFGTDVRFRPNHACIAKEIAAATKEITGATKAIVAPPNKNPDISRWEKQPITFLIHNISKEDEQTLLDRKVWSSSEITFQVASINIRRPTFLFTLRGFTTGESTDVLASLAEIWSDQATTALIKRLAKDAPTQEEGQEWYMQMVEFLDSASVKHLDIKSQGGKDDPHFNIYAKGDIIDDDETWLQLKKYLRNRNYKTMLIGTGSATEDFVCNICHGHDHPGGLCPFPRIPGWNVGYNTRKPNYTNTQQQTQLPPSSANSTSNNYGYRNANNRPFANTFSGRERGLTPPNRGRPCPY